jgi:ATP-dependent helicase/nuclease subunit A
LSLEKYMSSQPFELNHKFVQAGAGAGKTTSLTKHVFESLQKFYHSHKTYPHFVVCTFTVKATQELRERLVGLAYKNQDLKLVDVIKDPSSVSITTIHGLLNGLLKKHALDLGLQPDFQLQDELLEERYRKKLNRKILMEHSDLQTLLEVFTFRDLNEILYDLFLAKLNNPKLHPVQLQDLKQLLQREKEKLHLKIDKVLPLISNSEALKDFSDYLHGVKDDLKNIQDVYNVSLPRFSKKLAVDPLDWELISELYKFLKDNADKAYWDMEFWEDNIKTYGLVDRMFQIYFEHLILHKTKQSKICLSEIEGIANYLFDKYPNVCKKINEQVDYWYIDEFQDTSPVQMNILNKLILDTPFYVVGDPQQSIYLFRGADVSLFDKVQIDFKNKKYDVQKLDTNYRSHSALLSVVNDIFTPYGFLYMHAANPLEKNCSTELILKSENCMDQIFGIIQSLKDKGENLSKIAVLTKTNSELVEVQKLLLSKNIPVLVSASGGLFDNRFVKDLLYFLLFLANPHNNEVLFAVLKNPWFGVKEEDLQKIFLGSKGTSIWSEIQDNPAISILKGYLEKINKIAFSQLLQDFIVQNEILKKAFDFDASGLTYANIIKLQQILKEKEKSTDFQIIRFVKYCLGYYSPLDESEAVSPVLNDHVQLMTVHKSKGLEFDYVIIPFIHKAFRSYQFHPLVFDKEQTMWSLALPYGEDNAKKHNIFGHLQEESEENKKLAENIRLFYVAMTRAKNKVFLLGEEKSASNSWSSLLPNPFLSEVQYSTNNYDLRREEYNCEGAFKGELHALKVLPKANDILKPSKRFSVTQILTTDATGFSKSDTKQLLLAEHLGTKTHAILERWRFHQEQDTEVISYLKSQKEFPFTELMQTAKVEWGFSYKVGEYLMEGKVDLWGIVNNELWIVDYKTGSDRYRDKAFAQLQYYSLPIRHFAKIEKTHLVVVYPFAKKTYVKEADERQLLLTKMKNDLLDWQARNDSLIQSL